MTGKDILTVNIVTKICASLGVVTLSLMALSAHAQANGAKCPAAIKPVIVIGGNRFYKKGTVQRDTQLYDKNQASLRPVYDFQNQISSLSDKFVQTGSAQYKSCADRLLLSWARSNALSKFGSKSSAGDFQSNYVQQWAMAGLGLARLKLGPLNNGQNDRIVRDWLKRTALSVYDFHQKIKYHNNHYDWAVLAVGSVGFSIKDKNLIAMSQKMFDIAIAEIQPNGFLPLEMKRKERAAGYHSVAAQPLALYQLVRSRCGNDTDRPEKLIQLITLVKKLKADPGLLQNQADAKQLPLGEQPWINVWDTVNNNVSSEKPSASRYISGTSQTLSKVLMAGCPMLS
ncbi:hypothetical protein GS397_23865 [Sphingobium yanoikuyae]|uniref:Alginate lyase domain-containing protein n=1 Tax=Sphingobium yanoikuyae TaxID=13690 RepID=A0A6P1GPF5_SPHYA|nr:alginate lyase family protein [Sphingobium yanoikuyae]QHD69762.1 hypothetical protein GS397_23865 [Sphingobium yanoikuyae]